MASPKAFLGVARGPFLLLPFTLVASGAAAGAYAASVHWVRTLLALAGLVALHVAVNAFNEASDMRTGIDLRTRRTPFSGGSGTLPAGLMDPRTAFRFALAASGVGLAVGVVLLLETGPILLPILVLGAVCVLAYTDLLARSGVGETAVVQAGRIEPEAVAAAVPAFFMTFNLLLLNEFPDEEADRGGGRKNIVLLLGRRRAAIVYAVAAVLTPASIAVAVAARALPPLCLLGMLPSLLLVPPLRWALSGTARPVPNPALGANVAWNLLTNLAVAATLALS